MNRPMKVIRVVLRIQHWFLGSMKTHLIDQQININLCLIVPSGSCGLVGICALFKSRFCM
jgi:hypothetical protein